MSITTARKPEPLHVDFKDGITVEGYVAVQSSTGLTALASGGQSGATPLLGSFNVISTCATNGDSVLLPAIPQDGSSIAVWVKNNGAANAAVFPQVGDSINALSANASLTVNAAAKQLFVSVSGSNWQSFV